MTTTHTLEIARASGRFSPITCAQSHRALPTDRNATATTTMRLAAPAAAPAAPAPPTPATTAIRPPFTSSKRRHPTTLVILALVAVVLVACVLPLSVVSAQQNAAFGDLNLLSRPDIGGGQLFPANVSVAAGATVYMRLLSAVDGQTRCTYRRPGSGVDAVAVVAGSGGDAGDKCVFNLTT